MVHLDEFHTKAVHQGALTPRQKGAVVTPIYQSSTYEYHGGGYHDVGYMRLSNTPNHLVLGERIAALEGAESALVAASGMAAISTTFWTVLGAGDHVLVQDCLYGGTAKYLTRVASRFGIDVTVIDVQDPVSWEGHLRPTTRALYVETLTNPLVQVADLEAAARFAKEHGILSMVDNTFASPFNFRPIEHGFDLVLESCTKYMNGHNDVVAGSIAGSAELVASVKLTMDVLGGTLDTHACFLLERGLKTLPLRMERHNAGGTAVAKFLAEHPAVEVVNYPGLESHAQHERARRLFDGFGGMLSFELVGGREAAERFLARLTIPAVAPSLGGTESLIVRPAAAVHSGLSAEERDRMGVTEGLVRMSVGVEGLDDLIADLDEALAE